MRDSLLALERNLSKGVALASRATLVAAALIALWQVIARFVLESPADWSEVSTRLLLIWCVYLGSAMAFRRGAFVTVDLLQASLKGKAHFWLELAITVMTVVFLITIGILGVQLAWLTRFQTIVGLEVPISWGYLAIPVGALFSVLSVIAHHIDPSRQQLETSL